MKFETPFDEKTSRKQAKIIFNLNWEKPLKKTNKSIYYGIVFVLFGTLVVYGDDNLGWFFIASGIYLLFKLVNFNIKHKKSKKAYLKLVDNHINDYTANGGIITWEILDEWFCYADFKFEVKIKWNLIKNFKVIDDTIVLEVRENIISTFLLDRDEVGDHKFEKIIAFIETKIKRDGIL